MGKRSDPALARDEDGAGKNAPAKLRRASLTPLRTRWKVGEVWFLYVHPTGSENRTYPASPYPRDALRVTIIETGARHVMEETWLGTIEQRDGLSCTYKVVKPRGRGWKRHAEADRHLDKSTCWRRRRDWEVE